MSVKREAVILVDERAPAELDELDITEVVHSLWKGKWLIVAVTGAMIVLGGLFAYISTSTYQGTLRLSPILLSDRVDYIELNRTDFFPVTKDVLLKNFVEDLFSRGTLKSAIGKHDYIEREADENDSAYEARVLDEAYKFEVIPHENPNIGNDMEAEPEYWTIKFSTRDRKKVRLVLDSALRDSTESTRKLLIRRFEKKIEKVLRGLVYGEENLKDKVRNVIEDYDKIIRNRRAHLREQAAIARSMGLETSTLEVLSLNTSPSVIQDVKKGSLLYLRGYKAIEKEIELLDSREGRDEYIDELIDLEKEIRVLEQNKTVERARLDFNSSPIVKGEFKAAYYDLGSMFLENRNSKKTIIILVMSALVGLVLGVVILSIRNVILKSRLSRTGSV